MKKDKTEKFIKNWSLTRSQGKNKYIIINSIIYTIAIMIGAILTSLYTGNDVNFINLIGISIIGSIIGCILAWHATERKYNDLINK